MKQNDNAKLVKSLLHNPLDGIQITILSHADPTFHGISGMVVRETQAILVIKVTNHEIHVPKITGRFQFSISGMTIKINGEQLQGLSKARKKKELRNW
ncbi:MAG: ribonuclease P protein subunit [Candidatus Kariarchaeaceae archaeon]